MISSRGFGSLFLKKKDDFYSLKYHIGAAVEVAGRQVLDRIPQLRQWVTRRVRKSAANPEPVELAELESLLLTLGIREGDVLMVQSAWDGLRQLKSKPSAVVAMLKRLIGSAGTLIMPTGPIVTTSDVVQVYDVDRSPSSLGLLSESFRRMPGVKRSAFPMAPVCADGPLAEIFTRDFKKESGNTPYGRGSPYWQLGERNGKALILGIDFIRAATLFHCAFDLLGQDNPIRGFYIEKPYIVINKDREEQIMIRRPDPRWTSHLATGVFGKMIMESGTCKSTRLRGIKVALIDAGRFLAWHLEIARQFGWPYWGFPRAKKR
jgi:aminoglycoside 3-N-acetyltransferase